MPNKAKNIANLRFEKLVALRPSENKASNGSILWECICDCGTITFSTASDLRLKRKKSCGCLVVEVASKTAKAKAKHGMYKTRTYTIWANLIQRCTNTNSKHYKNYGAKGITVCKEWLTFEKFLLDMGEVPDGDYSIDRIDNTKGYSVNNCRWATRGEQNRNHSRNVYIEWMGKNMVLTDWSSELGININTLKNRLNKGWGINKAFTTPVNHNLNPRKNLEVNREISPKTYHQT